MLEKYKIQPQIRRYKYFFEILFNLWQNNIINFIPKAKILNQPISQYLAAKDAYLVLNKFKS
ncbi:hypothetical protein GENT11_12200 [Flavobacterium ammonificans]|uniref:Uncharacterized protein n=1 Tax=Flavobacterium ammonificans TaxID=1751056 RepID=A0ABM7V251_9FLAO|nr:hypothetical protein GENT11_12200 [Flavobacterium ammonificans]